MKHALPSSGGETGVLHRLPSWIVSPRGESAEAAAFVSGAALAHLHLMLCEATLPQALVRDRLALRAAEACVARSGRPERHGELRDEVHLLRPGDQLGPAGAVFAQWRQAVSRRATARDLHRALPAYPPERISDWLDAGPEGPDRGDPVARAASVLDAVRTACPRDELAALILADTALAQALGWKNIVPLLSVGLNSRNLRVSGAELRLACDRAIVRATREAVPLAADLTRRVARLAEVAPKLRAKGAEEAVEIVRTRDAIAPTALRHLMSDRAARRFCDRLVTLGVVRELTGRETFRLYGV